MENFRNLIKKLKDLNISIGEYAIFGSGPMAAKNLRDSHDLDIIVSNKIWKEYRKKPEWKLTKFTINGKVREILENNRIELSNGWGSGEWDINKLIKESEIIDGLPFVRLKEVLKWKKISNRDKDKKDIEILEKYDN
ncbi:hypothetical protein J4476_04995 [Candidatus Woesearchaeota archaeon]|nr:MAG: AraC family transcriptional regulator [archaeon GW2011_AR18]MBS3162020.1 hypothetical protein [Candidatus Woesearchaeota archaeon]HIH25939.1 hypothetical protein [Nanoarchaeota archaeon]